MPHEEPIPPLDAILDGSGVRYYSKRTRQLTSLEKKLEAARDAFNATRKEQGLADQTKLFHRSGSPPARAIALAGNAPSPVSSAALRRELRRQALDTTGRGSGPPVTRGPDAATSAVVAVNSGSSGGGAAMASTARSHSGRDSDFQRFADSLVGSGRGPVVVAKPYHTEARTHFNLSLLPSSVKDLAADSGLYYSPVATMRGVPGPAAKGLREDMKFRYFHSELAMEREEREKAVQMEMSERLATAQEALGVHIQALVARWGPGFLERLTAAAAAEASGEAGRSTRISGASIASLSAGGGTDAAGVAAGGGGRQSPLKLHLSAGGMNVPISAADAVYEFEHYRSKASGHPRCSSSPPPIGGTAGRLYGISDMRVSASTMERLSYLSVQLKVPVEQIMTLLRKPGSAGDGKTSPTSNGTKRAGGGGGNGHIVSVAGARQSRRIELQPARRKHSMVGREASSAARAGLTAGVERGDALDAQVAAIMAGAASAAVADGSAEPAPGETSNPSPFEDGAVAMQAQASEQVSPGTTGVVGSGETNTASAAATATSTAVTGASRYESQKTKHRHIHLVVAAAVAERDAAEARAAAAKAKAQWQQTQDQQQQQQQPKQQPKPHHRPKRLSQQQHYQQQQSPDTALETSSSVATANAKIGEISTGAARAVTSSGEAVASQAVTEEVPRTPVDRDRPSAARAQPPTGDAGAGGQFAGSLTDDAKSPTRHVGSRMTITSPSMHQVWSAFPSRRTCERASASPPGSPSGSLSPIVPRLITSDGDGSAADAGMGGAADQGSLPGSPMAYHHPSGLSYVKLGLGHSMPAGPSLDGLQPVDPRQGELEAASRAVLESLARRHGDSHRTSRHHQQNNNGVGGSRAGSASTASRPGTSGGMVDRGGGTCQSQRRNRSRPTSRLSGTGTSFRGASGGNGEQRRTTVGGINIGRVDDSGWEGSVGGGGLRFSERGSGGDDDGEGGRGGGNDSGTRRRSGRMRSGGSKHSARSVGGIGGSGGTSARRRGRASPLSAHSHAGAGLTGSLIFGSGAPGSSGEEIIFANAGKQSPRRSAAGSQPADSSGAGGGGMVSVISGLRRLSDLAVSVGLHAGNNRSRRNSSPRSSASAGAGAAGLLDSSDDDILVGSDVRNADDGQEENDTVAPLGSRFANETWGTNGGGRLGSRPSTSTSVNIGGMSAGGHVDMAAAMGAVQVAKLVSLQPPPGQTVPSSSAPSGGPLPATVTAISIGADSRVSGLLDRSTSDSNRPEAGLNPPSLSRHYKLAGSRWNPTAPGALRPGYGLDSDYVAGTYNPDLMERVAAARDTAALTGEEVPVDYKSPVQAASARSVLLPPPTVATVPLTQRQSMPLSATASGTQPTMQAMPMGLVRTSLDLSLLTPAGRAAAANAKAALAIADVLNPVTRVLTNTAVLAAGNGSDLPAPLQALAAARISVAGGHTTAQLPAATMATMATAVAQQLVGLPASSRTSPDMSLRRTGGGVCPASAGGGPSGRSAAVEDPAKERVVSRTMRPSQSVWGRSELDEHDILQPLNQHLAANIWATSAANAVGPSGPRPTAAPAIAAAAGTAAAAATAAERRVATAPAGTRAVTGAPLLPPPAATTRLPIPEPRLWRGNPLDLKAAFPKGEKVYRLVTDVQANARLLREVEKDITPVEFRNRLRRGVVL